MNRETLCKAGAMLICAIVVTVAVKYILESIFPQKSVHETVQCAFTIDRGAISEIQFTGEVVTATTPAAEDTEMHVPLTSGEWVIRSYVDGGPELYAMVRVPKQYNNFDYDRTVKLGRPATIVAMKLRPTP